MTRCSCGLISIGGEAGGHVLGSVAVANVHRLLGEEGLTDAGVLSRASESADVEHRRGSERLSRLLLVKL